VIRILPGFARWIADRVLAGAIPRVFPALGKEGRPATFARYAWTSGGAIHGPAVGTRHPPARTPIAGLVLAGAGVFPGAGVEAVVISGTIAADTLRPVAGPSPAASSPVAG
jgi:all-trans-retinol 13,14-reductase